MVQNRGPCPPDLDAFGIARSLEFRYPAFRESFNAHWLNYLMALKGGMRAKQRRAIAGELSAIPDGQEKVLLATPDSALALN